MIINKLNSSSSFFYKHNCRTIIPIPRFNYSTIILFYLLVFYFFQNGSCTSIVADKTCSHPLNYSASNNNSNSNTITKRDNNSRVLTLQHHQPPCYIHSNLSHTTTPSSSYKGRMNESNISISSESPISSSSSSVSDSSPTTVRLLTYNVFVRPPGIKNNHNDYKDERLECMISSDLNAHKLDKLTSSPKGTTSSVVPFSLYVVDKDRFPSIPYLSPWRSPRPNHHHHHHTHANGSSSSFEQELESHSGKSFSKLDGSILGQFDIICLQELFSAFSFRQKRFIEKAKKQNFLYSATSPLPRLLRTTFLVDGGIVVLSKHPIVKTEYLQFKQGVDSDMLASKGALYTKIQITRDDGTPGSEYIHLFSTHLQASYNPSQEQLQKGGGRDNQMNDSVRTIQLNQLRDFIIEMTKSDSYPVILAGDLNVDGKGSKTDPTKDSKEYQEMIAYLSRVPPTGDDEPQQQQQQQATPPQGGKKVYKIADLLKEDVGCHPATVGDTIGLAQNSIPRETCLTHPNDYGCLKRLDYIFLMDRVNDTTTTDECRVKGTTKVEPFFIEGFPFTQLSDHYGVSTNLQFYNNQQ
ncbi:putative sphingomyelinase [Cavenderia fasciculata]|uniref:sphingomyelin phosphodiesterase n=1 Tax=Cavenderia fasciculata TaxID=261658 RepID=F4PTD6_CACFS|nr:putative sphingomyelinase [Cavenderia fasciculata]EGG21658.1 putative sphingomyelinase [Cavenderia fasciculata]|eukprot:XP_004359508.1 putative sphingomyelinase [Cavenderia fasciculata]